MIISTLHPNDLIRWRAVASRHDVAESGNPNMTVEEAIEAINEYWMEWGRIIVQHDLDPEQDFEIDPIFGHIKESSD